MSDARVLLGFEVGTGERVEIPIAHTFVTGQTQLSGKTTTLRAIVERSKRRALAFVTKRGETFPGRRIPPYLPREGDKPIHWRLVETILASALGQRNMKWERIWLINAVKRPAAATSLAIVRSNVAALLVKAKGDRSVEAYTLIGEYLDLVLPDMRALNAADRLELHPGLNVMDLAGVGQQLQALVIRASLEHINHKERDVLTVFPEAWEFAPRQTNTPAKDEAIAMARKGAVLGNFLLCDSQDIAGVDTVIRQAASVWILGVQRELNELKRTIQTIPAGIKRPKPEDVAQLEVGEFYACWGRHAVKTYVMPSGVSELEARAVALGQKPRPRLATAPAHMTSTVKSHRVPVVHLEPAKANAAVQIAVHGPGPTFGELAIGERFEWPAPIPRGPEPMVKTSLVRYEWSRGYGTAEPFDRVERVTKVGRSAGGATGSSTSGPDVETLHRPADTNDEEHEMNPAQEKKLDQAHDSLNRVAALLVTMSGKLQVLLEGRLPATSSDGPVPRASKVDPTRPPAAEMTDRELEDLYQQFRKRLLEDVATDPQILEVLVRQPELRVKVERHTIEVDGDTLQGRLALLIVEGFFDEAKTSGNAFAIVTSRGFKTAHPNVARELGDLARMGFVTRSNKWYTAVPAMKSNIVAEPV